MRRDKNNRLHNYTVSIPKERTGLRMGLYVHLGADESFTSIDVRISSPQKDDGVTDRMLNAIGDAVTEGLAFFNKTENRKSG